jgi:hypothetical protein
MNNYSDHTETVRALLAQRNIVIDTKDEELTLALLVGLSNQESPQHLVTYFATVPTQREHLGTYLFPIAHLHQVLNIAERLFHCPCYQYIMTDHLKVRNQNMVLRVDKDPGNPIRLRAVAESELFRADGELLTFYMFNVLA